MVKAGARRVGLNQAKTTSDTEIQTIKRELQRKDLHPIRRLQLTKRFASLINKFRSK